jgi:hypothetical protein
MIPFVLPDFHTGITWHTLVDTAYEQGLTAGGRFPGSTRYDLQGRSLALLIEIHQA